MKRTILFISLVCLIGARATAQYLDDGYMEPPEGYFSDDSSMLRNIDGIWYFVHPGTGTATVINPSDALGYLEDWEGLRPQDIMDPYFEIDPNDCDYKGDLVIPSKITAKIWWTRKYERYWYNQEFTVTVLGSGCFYYSKTTSIELPETIDSIGSNAFGFCTFKEINLRKTRKIPYGALTFQGSNISKISVDPDNAYLDVIDNVLYSKSHDSILAFLPGDERECMEIPEGVTKIMPYGFANSKSLKEVVLPSTMLDIRERAFNNSSINKVQGMENVRTIGEFAFFKCPIKFLHIHENMKEIGLYAFANCQIQEVVVPATLEVCMDPFRLQKDENDTRWWVYMPIKVYFESETPPRCELTEYQKRVYLEDRDFDFENNTLIVPDNALAAYRNHPQWGRYKHIGTYSDPDGILSPKAEEPEWHPIFDLQGRQLKSAPQKGIYIQNGKKVLVK